MIYILDVRLDPTFARSHCIVVTASYFFSVVSFSFSFNSLPIPCMHLTPCLLLSRQPTLPADDPYWSKPKPSKFGQLTPIPPRNEPPLCPLHNIDTASLTAHLSELSVSATGSIEQMKHVENTEKCWCPTYLNKSTNMHLKVSWLFY